MSFRKYRETALSEMDSQRALLDSLMGVNRNNDREQDKVKDYNDSRICKNYLLGLCPHDLFGNTKMDLGPCPKFHTEEFKREFENNLGDMVYYENILEKEIIGYLQEADKKIKRARERLEGDDERLEAETNPQVLKINADIIRCINQVESAGESGNIDYAMDMMARVDALHQERFAILSKLADEKSAGRPGIDVNEKLRVCDICGAFLSIYDSDQRLADHFVGKLHLGFQTMRNKLDEINRRRNQRKIKEYEERMKRQNTTLPEPNPAIQTPDFLKSAPVDEPKPKVDEPELPLQVTEEPISSKKDENGRANHKGEEKNSRGRRDRNRSHSRSANRRSSSRSGSVSSLGSDSSAIIRRRKRRQNMEKEQRTREKDRKRDRRDRSESEGPRKRRIPVGDMSEEEGEERDPSVSVNRGEHSRDNSHEGSRDRRSNRY